MTTHIIDLKNATILKTESVVYIHPYEISMINLRQSKYYWKKSVKVLGLKLT